MAQKKNQGRDENILHSNTMNENDDALSKTINDDHNMNIKKKFKPKNNNRSRCYLYLKNRRLFSGSKQYKKRQEPEEEKITFTCLDGGYVEMGEDDIVGFVSNYAESVRRREKMYLAEVATNVCKYYCDFDFEYNNESEIIPFETFKKVLLFIYEQVEYHFGTSTYFLCSATGIKRKKNLKIKQGYHVVFGEIFISKQNALILTDYIIKKLLEKFPKYDWRKILDKGVYGNGGGLRMIYSLKGEKNNKSISKVGEDDDQQGGDDDDQQEESLKDDDAQSDEEQSNDQSKLIYWPKWEYPEDVEYDHEYDCFEKSPTSIENLILKSFIQNVFNEVELQPHTKLLKDVFHEYRGRINLRSMGSLQIKDETIDPVTYGKMQIEICHLFQNIHTQVEEWKQAEFHVYRSIFEHVYYVRSSSNYCMNIGKHHNSENIYFTITPCGMSQKCFCKCDTLHERKFGYCKDFKSTLFKVPPRFFKVFYPKLKQSEMYKLVENPITNFTNFNKTDKNKHINNSLHAIKFLEKKMFAKLKT